jgi:steroid 5-alpha reductase family enzyme
MFFENLLHIAVGLIVLMILFFIIAQFKRNNSLVDIAWGLGFVFTTLYSLINTGLYSPRQLLVTTLVLVWGLRLVSHLFKRNWSRGEDPRYVAIIGGWKDYILARIFLTIFMLQAALILIISYPVILINSSAVNSFGLFDVVGFFVWLQGFIFELIGDYQLRKFMSNPANRGRIMQTGLWRYTRHPNYFGESCMWWGIFIIALSVPFGWTSIISPITITYLLLYVSGIPLAEKSFEGNPEYEHYKKSTSPFFPWWSIN